MLQNKRVTLCLTILLVMLWSIVPSFAMAQTATLNMQQFGKQTVTVSDELTFYDMKGESNITSSSTNNSVATVVFKPADAGKAIQITFESLDVRSDGSNYPAYVNVYSGVFDADDSFSYPTTTSGVTGTRVFPTNDALLATLEGQYTNLVYTSTDATGAMSVCFQYRYAKTCSGWVAKVRQVEVKDMAITGASTSYTSVPASVYAGKKDVTLGTLKVATEGFMNADTLKSVTVKTVKNGGVIDPTALKVYSGDSQLSTTVTTVADGEYTLAVSGKLISGDNEFTIKTDVLENAPFDSEVSMQIAGFATSAIPGGYAGTITQGETAVSKVARMVLMSTTAATYTVGDSPFSFYDDGGPEGTISQNFSGQVTFVPETAGKKVMIDFSMIDLFNTSSIGKNDILKVYYGRSANADSLAATYLKETAATIRSIAADGSLTVTLASSTGTGFKKGFEATVSQFTPQAMTLSGITATQPTTTTVAAGDTIQPIMCVKVSTANTEPALKVQKFAFTTAGTNDAVSRASLYYTGKNATFSATRLAGRASVSADEFDVTLSEPVGLTEGDNYFWLAYDVKETALTGAAIDATVKSVTISDSEQAVADGAPEGERKVDNVVLASIGTTRKTIYGEWTFKNTPQSAYSDGYASTAGDQIVVLTPGTADHKIEIEFSKFSISYPYYSSYSNPYFRIYSGSTVDADNLLWECTKESKDAGPGSKLRSASADGVMTIVFNANGTGGYSAGWKAAVREYQSVPMTVDSVVVTQASTASISVAETAKSQAIIGFDVVAKGDKDPLLLSALNLNLKGCQDKATRVIVYRTSTSAADAALTDTVAMATPDASSATLAVSLTQPVELSEGDNHFVVAYDMADGLSAGLSIDAALTSLNIGGSEIAVANGDPEGVRSTTNIYLMQSGTGHVVTVGADGLMFYDDGGADGKTSKGLKGTVTFVPRDPGKVVRMVIKEWSVGANDRFNLSFGAEAKTTPDVQWSNTKASVGTDLRSLSDDGKLTFNVSAGSYYQGDGWAIEVSEYELQPLSLDTIVAVPQVEEQVMPGSTEVMQRIDVKVDGDKGSFKIGQIKINAESTDASAIAAVRLVATDTASVYAAGRVLDEIKPLAATSCAFNADYTATLPGTYRFWVVYDISSDVTAGNTVKAKVSSVNAGGIDVSLDSAPVATTTIGAGMHGTYTVGASAKADFASIGAAVNAMAAGIDGPVVLQLENGNYNEVVEIKNIKGASATNTITLRSQSGKYQDVTIYDNKYNEPAYSDDKSAREFGVVTVYGTPYVTIDGVTISSTDTSYPSVLRLQQGSSNFTLRNSKLTAPETESYSADIDLCETYVGSNNPQGVCDNVTFEGNVFEGGYNGITSGSQWITNPYESGLVIKNNVFRNQGSKGLYIMYSDGAVITGNTFDNNVSSKSDFNGVDVTLKGSSRIERNTFSLSTKNYATAIYVRAILATEDAPGVIANNEVNISSESTSASYALRFTSASENVNVAYNTLRIAKGGSSSPVVMVANDVNRIVFANNLLQNEAGGYTYRLNKATYSEGLSFATNAMHTSGNNIAYAGAAVEGLDDWTKLTSDSTSRTVATTFVSDMVLMPSSGDQLAFATPLSYVTTDLTGAQRGATPTVGAYEFTDNFAVPAYADGYPQFAGIANNSASMTIKTDVSGMASVLVQKASLPAPEAATVEASDHLMEVRGGVEYALDLTGLETATDYKAYTVFYSLTGETGSVVAQGEFTTAMDPTQVSTFENVTTTDTGFTDGTAAFKGFDVVAVTDAVVEGTKVAQVAAGATGEVSITNSLNPIKLNGFFLKSTADAKATTADTTFVIPSTAGKWMFVNLRDKGLIATLALEAGDGGLQIDNFSGEPLPIVLALADTTVEQGNTVTVNAGVKPWQGVAPYTYKWTDIYGNDYGSADVLSAPASKLVIYRLKVTDAWGDSAIADARVTVIGKAVPATFEEVRLAEESYWNGETPSNSAIGRTSNWYSGSYLMTVQKHTATWWGGMAVSNETSTTFSSLTHQFRASTGGGHNSANYGVYYPLSDSDVCVTNRAEGDTIAGFYVTNNAYALSSMLDGDSFAKAFKKGDYFKLTVTGYGADNAATGSVDFYLGDYRAENEADRYCLDTWQWVDLRKLGRVKRLKFGFSGTQTNSVGLTTPMYFCIDDINGSRDITTADEVTVPIGDKTLQLAGLFNLDGNGATVTYALPDGIDSTAIVASLADGVLTLTGKEDGATTYVLLSATECGKTQFVRVPVRVERSTGVVDADINTDVVVYPVPVTTTLNVATGLSGYAVSIYNAAGAEVYARTGIDGNLSVDRGNWASGVYVIKITAADGHSTVRRFTVK